MASPLRSPPARARVVGEARGARYRGEVISRLRYALPVAVISGFLLALAFEPFGWQSAFPLTVPIAVAGLFLSTGGLRSRVAWLPGLGFGVAFCYPLMWWLQAVGPDAFAALAGLEALFFGILGAVLPVLRRLPGWPVWFAVAYVAVEVWRSHWPFGGMPWGRLPYASAENPYAEALPWFGMTGVSLVMALGAALLTWLVLHAGQLRTDRAVRLPAALVAAAYLLVTAVPTVIDIPLADDGEAVVAVVQGDVPGDGSDILLDHRQVTRNLADATEDLADDVAAGSVPEPDFVLWPENSTATDPFVDQEVNQTINRGVDAIGRPVLVGGIVETNDGENLLNQGIVWLPGSGGIGDRYTKRHPVPFGEYIPLRDKVFSSNFGNLRMISRDMLPGDDRNPLRIADLLVADAICFDIAYDDGIYEQIGNGGQLLVVQTSNAKYIHTKQIDQQFEITRVRALETGRSVAVSSPNGISGVIGADGSVVAVAEPRTRTVLVEKMPLSTTLTPAVRLGALPSQLTVAAALGGLTWAIVLAATRRRSGKDDTAAQAPVSSGSNGGDDAAVTTSR